MLQNGKVPRLADISVSTGNQPQRVIIEAAAHIVVAPFCQRLVLMIGGAVRPLDGGNVDDAFPGTLRRHVDKTQQILAAVPEPHAPSGTGLKVAGTAAHIKGDHALVLVPGVHHTVELLVAAFQGVDAQQLVPIFRQFRQGILHGCIRGELFQHPVGGILADDAGSQEFPVSGIFAIAEDKHKSPFFAGCKGYIQRQSRHRCAAVGDKIAGLSTQNSLRSCKSPKGSQKMIPVGVVARNGGIHAVIGIVIPPLPVFGFVINCAAFHFQLADVQVPLEIGGVIHRVPQAPLYGSGEAEALGFR